MRRMAVGAGEACDVQIGTGAEGFGQPTSRTTQVFGSGGPRAFQLDVRVGSCDVTKALLAEPKVAYCVAGNVNSADGLFLVIDSVLADTKHVGCSTVPVFSDGAGGSPIG